MFVGSQWNVIAALTQSAT